MASNMNAVSVLRVETEPSAPLTDLQDSAGGPPVNKSRGLVQIVLDINRNRYL